MHIFFTFAYISTIKRIIMKAFFEAIQFLFEEVILLPYDFFRALELQNWFGANIINWSFMQWFIGLSN